MLRELIKSLYAIANAIKGKSGGGDSSEADIEGIIDFYGEKAVQSANDMIVLLKLYAKDVNDIPDFENKFKTGKLLITDVFDGDVVRFVKLLINILNSNEVDANFNGGFSFIIGYDEYLQSHQGYEDGIYKFKTKYGIKGIDRVTIAAPYHSIIINCYYRDSNNPSDGCGWYFNLKNESDPERTNIKDLLTTPIQGITTD